LKSWAILCHKLDGNNRNGESKQQLQQECRSRGIFVTAMFPHAIESVTIAQFMQAEFPPFQQWLQSVAIKLHF